MAKPKARSRKTPSPMRRAHKLMYRVLETKLEASIRRGNLMRKTGCSWTDAYDDRSVKAADALAHRAAQKVVDELTRLYQLEAEPR